ncbi:hypothetical protein [Cyanobium sp. ATX-6F1]|uniref:hypothetical protein n=1 Tax=Cyanobium sp. ATX-6F1 TaxID=3137388 RepID=UPI0039BDFC73
MSGQASEGELKELNLILKADVQGSVEAILGSLSSSCPKAKCRCGCCSRLRAKSTETDVDLAAASGAVIVGFNTSMAPGAKRAADATGVDVRDYDVIYKLLEDIQMAMEGLLEPELVEESLGEAEVRAVFTIGRSAVAGCYVTTGKLQRATARCGCGAARRRCSRATSTPCVATRTTSRKSPLASECGIGTDRYTGWQEADRVEAYKLVTQRRTLST